MAAVTLRLYMDYHVPSAVAEGLRLRGVDVLTAYTDAVENLPGSSTVISFN